MPNARPIPGGDGTFDGLSHYYSVFPLPALTFTLLACPCWLLAFSYFLTADIKFSCSFSKEIRILFFISRSSSFSVIHVSVDKNLTEKGLEFVVYFTLKVGVARVFALKTSSYNWVAIPVDWVILQWRRYFYFLRSGSVFFIQWNTYYRYHYRLERIFKRSKEGNVWWMWWFHVVRCSNLWLLRLFFSF